MDSETSWKNWLKGEIEFNQATSQIEKFRELLYNYQLFLRLILSLFFRYRRIRK